MSGLKNESMGEYIKTIEESGQAERADKLLARFLEKEMSKEDQVTTRKIEELLKDRHPSPEWATFVELNIGTGARGYRWIDFFAFNMYPSKRYLKIAYEIKVSRSDFFRELEDPTKRAPAERLADECYFVMPVGLVLPDEIPEGWGLIEVVANGLRVKKRAQQRRVDELPISFVASIARRSTDDGPTLPKAYWLVAGKEVTDEELEKLASDRVLQQVDRQISRAKLEAQMETEKRYASAIDLKNYIGQRLGYQFTDIGVFSKWIDGNGVTVYPPRLANQLSRIKNMIAELEKEVSK